MRIFLSKPHMSGRERTYVEQAFDSNYVAPLGPHLDAFEASVARYLGGGVHCVALSSGSAALHIALRIAGVTSGDEVWVSSMTFAGGIFPVLYLGATPVFFDLNPESWTIDTEILRGELRLARNINKLPKAIIPTDLYGQSVDIEQLENLCAEYGIKLIVDSAESFGAEYKEGRKCGTGGDTAVLSFNGNKIITTSGGGMLVSKSKAVVDSARFLSTQARDPAPHYEHSTFGYNYRLSNICAAIGLGQIEVLDERVASRRAIFDRYKRELQRPGISFMPEPDGYKSSRWLSSILIDPSILGVTREDIRRDLLGQEIEARPLWKPMHMQPLFDGARYVGRGFDQRIFEIGLSLPSGSDLTENEQGEVIDRINKRIDRT